MPHAIPQGAFVRRDADRLTRLTLDEFAAPDFAAAASIPYDRAESLARLQADYKAGRVAVIVFRDSGRRVGQLFYAIEGDTLRIKGGHSLPAAMRGAHFEEAMRMVDDFARRAGCRAIVTDTSRPGVLKAHAAQGYRVSEVTLIKSL